MSDIVSPTARRRRRTGRWAGWFELLVGFAALFVALGVAFEARERVFAEQAVEPSAVEGRFGDAQLAVVTLESSIGEFTDELLSARLRSQPLARERLESLEQDWIGSVAAISAAFTELDFDQERRSAEEISRSLSAVLVSLSTIDPTPAIYDSASLELGSITEELDPLRSALVRAEIESSARDQRALEDAAASAVERLGSDIAIVAAGGLALALALVSIGSGIRRIRRSNLQAQPRNSSSIESSSNTARSASDEITRSARNEERSDHSEPSADSRTVKPAAVRVTAK